ncbi:MAG: hypothetical protein M3Y57_07550 [Acidobacteriota bacterium]|nr:hypothetical protein [Acidobacteriota bacterium]
MVGQEGSHRQPKHPVKKRGASPALGARAWSSELPTPSPTVSLA